jgi:hypothetical protein
MKVYCDGGYAGRVECRRNRVTGTMVGLYHTARADMDEDSGKWSAVCEDHGSILSCDTLRQARGFMTDVADWCEDCREKHDGS